MCVCVCVCCAFVGLDNKLYKMHSTYYFRISKYVILITFPRQHSMLSL